MAFYKTIDMHDDFIYELSRSISKWQHKPEAVQKVQEGIDRGELKIDDFLVTVQMTEDGINDLAL